MKRWMIVVAVLAGCRLETPEVPPLAVEYSGCTSVLAGPVCEVGAEGRLALWLADDENVADQPVEVRLSWLPVVADRVAVGGGHRLQVQVPAGALPTELTVQRGGARWRLALRADSRPSAVLRADALRQKDPSGALALLEAASEGTPADQGQVTLLRGKVLRQLGRLDEALEALKGAERVLAQAGHWSGSTNAAEVASFLLADAMYQFGASEEVLRGHPADGAAWPEGRARVAYYRTEPACGSGDYRRCFRLLDEAEYLTEHIELTGLHASVRSQRARVLSQLGHHEAALEVMEGAVSVANERPSCFRAMTLNNLALAQEAAGRPWPEVHAVAQVALQMTDACEDEEQRTWITLTAAQIALNREQASEAAALLATMPAAMPSTRLRLWSNVLHGQLYLAQAQWSLALKALEQARVETTALGFRVLAYNAAIGVGRAWVGLGRTSQALEAFEAADQIVSTVLAEVPVGSERESFVGDRDGGLRYHIALLISLDRAAQALELSRRSRTRALASLQLADRIDGLDEARRRRWQEAIGAYRQQKAALEVDDWSATAEERGRRAAARPAAEAALRRQLDDAWAVVGAVPVVDQQPPLEPGEVLLHYRRGLSGWWAFRQSAEGVAVAEIADPLAASTPAEQAARLLGPFADSIRAARRVRFVVSGPLAGLDLHGLPFEGAPLWQRMPVAFGVDVPAPVRVPGTRALVVADPRSDLVGARRSGQAAAALLQARLLQGEAARREAVLEALGQADLFIYTGHGALAGDGWASHLRLAGEDQLVPGDLLLQPRLPRRVVLAGCETGRVPARSAAVGMSLAHAFVVGGAQAVIATTRPVADDEAARLLEALQVELTREDDLARALQSALARVGEPMDRTAWRVVVR